MIRYAHVLGLCAALGVAGIHAASAADYPTRTIQIVVPYAAGGGVDLTARVVAQQMSEDTGQSVVVINKPGASGVVGSQFVSSAKPDGYTLLLASGVTEATAPFILGQTSFDLMRDLTPVAEVAYGSEIVVVNPKFPAKTFGDLVTYIKQHPTTFRWGVGGLGTLEHLTITALDQRLGVKPVVAPYNGVAPATVATISGEINATLLPLAGAKGNLEAGTL
ncbi:MAG TPA: tripartite tricarboxylate transporter substrate binding protein, partial [Stellaceae bacterium]|nr:tripartite tricarboxylate transporter substrate binding protein [Stellaceae bacterium]